ncbi:MAG: hypoxanthine phosphoribosyltransferase [Chloroflexi bacterium]|nr:hypoxanthine phosphoribosyltransferase [Chloroflexota bacterium]
MDAIAKVLVSEQEIAQRVRELGQQISRDYEGQDLLLTCILKGGVAFLVDLMREVTIPHEIDFIAISSYGQSTESSGVVRILKDLDRPIEGRHVLIVEDIVDTGRTLSYIISNLRTRNPASVRICTLLSKPARREIDIPVDYIGFEVPNEFVVGYGLDYAERYRNLRFVGVLHESVYKTKRG